MTPILYQLDHCTHPPHPVLLMLTAVLWSARIASGLPAVFIACLGLIDHDRRHVAVTVLCLTFFINTFSRAGFMVNIVDISPRSEAFLLLFKRLTLL